MVERLRDEILAAPGRRISFARYMERALTEPGLGYYATSQQRPTREGDFLTASELHPFFGRCLGRHLDGAWRDLGEPSRFVVREWGSGRGTLAAAVLEGLRADGSALAGHLDWQPLDLDGRHPPPPQGSMEGVVLANEFVDALPVHRVSRRGERLVEHFVTWSDGWFAELVDEPSTPALADHLAADGVRLADGQRAEICLAARDWMTRAAAELARGWLLIIDYGHEAAELYGPRRLSGSLVTYRDHRAGDDPFTAVGHQDITAHVDLTALARAAAEVGLDGPEVVRQADFLASLGLGDLLSEMGRRPGTEPADYLAARASVLRLVDPRHLGGFSVLRWSRGVPRAGQGATAAAG